MASTRTERARLAILRALDESNGAAGASRLALMLSAKGLDLHPRTVRFHLREMDRLGLTALASRRKGRILTPQGVQEIHRAGVAEKVGFIAAKVDALGYQMTYRSDTKQGSVVLNVTFLDPGDLSRALVEMHMVFDAGLGMGRRLVVAHSGEMLGHVVVPDHAVAVGTVCSVTVNGILQHEGIPVTSRYGGLLQMKARRPLRFVELIEYSGTSLDPLEIFIQADMTSVRDAVRTGDGVIGASFREVPSVALDDIRRMAVGMKRAGLGGILVIGRPNQPLFGIPVSEGRTGMVVVAGMNPIAAVHEAGIRVSNRSLAGLHEFSAIPDIAETRRRVWRARQLQPPGNTAAQGISAPRSA